MNFNWDKVISFLIIAPIVVLLWVIVGALVYGIIFGVAI